MRLFIAFVLIVLIWFPSNPVLASDTSTNCSIYPTSPSCASLDNDGDGQPNSSDPYPNDAANNDSDGDGVPNNEDVQPNDPTNDSDSDGVPNNQDSLPKNPANDTDGDGTPNNQDAFPIDPTKGGSSPSPSASSSPSPSTSPSPSSSPSASTSPSSGTGVFGWLGSIWNSFSGFLSTLWNALSKIFAVVLGAIANPLGAVNAFICMIIDIVAAVWPSTPDSLKISNILVSFSTAFPLIGYGVVVEITQTIGTIFLLFAAIKIYKLIPFKMS